MRMPIESERASIVMLLNVNPKAFIRVNVAMTDVGKATALISVVLIF